MSATRDAALELAAAGVRVLPLHAPGEDEPCSCGRADCPSPAKHPRTRRGVTDATTDAGRIYGYWRRWPLANLAVATGGALAVLDVDPRNGGDDALAALLERHGTMPDTPTVATGGGGFHHYFRAADVPSFVREDGLEIKGKGAYVVAPPSLHVSGRQYAWTVPFDPMILAPLPGWLRPPEPSRRPGSAPSPERGEDFLRRLDPPRYFAELCGIEVPRSGKVRCPLPGHDDRTPSCHVYEDAESGWYCYGCRRGGDVFDLAGWLTGRTPPLRGADFLTVEAELLSFYEARLVEA